MRWQPIEQVLRKRLAANVRSCRLALGLSVEDASAGLMSSRQWQRIEGAENSVTIRMLAKLAEALDVDPVELLR